MRNTETERKDQLFALLHKLEQRLSLPAVEELIRLIGSPLLEALSPGQIRNVGDYACIEIAGERFFERAFSPGKEAASALALARMIGPERVLDDLRHLHASLAPENTA